MADPASQVHNPPHHANISPKLIKQSVAHPTLRVRDMSSVVGPALSRQALFCADNVVESLGEPAKIPAVQCRLALLPVRAQASQQATGVAPPLYRRSVLSSNAAF